MQPLNGLTSLRTSTVPSGKVDQSKPLLVIFNPAAGMNPDINKQKVREGLDNSELKYDFYETKGRLDCFNQVKEADLDKYGGIVLCGGDGTIHEGLNGMMYRKD